VVEIAAELRDRDFYLQQVVGRGRAQNDNYLGLYHGYLTQQERPAGRGFDRFRSTITGRATTVYIADKNLFAAHSNALDDLCQKLAGTSHKRKALFVLVRSGSLADKHQACVEIARAVNDLRPAECMKRTARAITYF